MALVKCPECGYEVSSIAVSCPKCGYPIASNSQNNIEEPQISFPVLPVVMNVGKQITNWSGDAAVQKAYYLAEINYTNYINEGKVSILAHTNGICIVSGLKFFYISHEQLIDMKFTTHKQLATEEKSVIGRAVVGGLLLGPFAAVVGGISGIGSKTKTLGNYLFVINFWDVYTHSIQTLLFCTECESLEFIDRVNSEKQKQNHPEGNNYVCNIVDDKGTLSEEKVIEALKAVGETALAKEIGCIEGCGEMTALQKVKNIGLKKQINTAEYKSAGCMVTLLMMFSGLLSILAIVTIFV